MHAVGEGEEWRGEIVLRQARLLQQAREAGAVHEAEQQDHLPAPVDVARQARSTSRESKVSTATEAKVAASSGSPGDTGARTRSSRPSVTVIECARVKAITIATTETSRIAPSKSPRENASWSAPASRLVGAGQDRLDAGQDRLDAGQALGVGDSERVAGAPADCPLEVLGSEGQREPGGGRLGRDPGEARAARVRRRRARQGQPG